MYHSPWQLALYKLTILASLPLSLAACVPSTKVAATMTTIWPDTPMATTPATTTSTPTPTITLTPTPTEISYAEKLAQAPVKTSISPGFGFEGVNVTRPESVKAALGLAILYKAGQIEPYPTSPEEIEKRVAGLGESGADFGGIDPTKGVDIKVVTMAEGQNFSLAYGDSSRTGVPIEKEAVIVDETGKVTIIVAVDPNNLAPYMEGLTLTPEQERPAKAMEFAIDRGVIHASQEIAVGPIMSNLQGAEWDKANKYVNFITGNDCIRTLGLGWDSKDVHSMTDVTGQGK